MHSRVVRVNFDEGDPEAQDPSFHSQTPAFHSAPRNHRHHHHHLHSQRDDLVPYHEGISASWNWWQWMVVLQGIAILGLALGLILVATNRRHSGHYYLPPPPASMGAIRSVPVGGELEPSKVARALGPAQNYAFKLTGVFSRYPTGGGYIPSLDAASVQKSQCCCTYRKVGKTVRESRTCATLGGSDAANPLLKLELAHDDHGSYAIVTATQELLDAQCTMSWV